MHSPYATGVVSSKGFSLIELLAVVALISMLVGMSTFALKGNAGVARLASASGVCATLLDGARETAIVRKSPVAVAFFPSTPQAPAAVTALQYEHSTKSWSHISRWERLPTGVAFDPGQTLDSNAALASNSPAVSSALPEMNYAGMSYSPGAADGYAYMIFLPSGALFQEHANPAVLHLVEGAMTGESFQRTGSSGQTVSLVINPSTGRVKIVRPE